METISVTFPPGSEPVRLDTFLAGTVPGLSRAMVQRLIEDGRVTLAGAVPKPSLKLRGGEEVAVSIPPPRPAAPQAEAITLEILFEDCSVVVVNKPAGMVVHPAAGNPSGTLVNALLGHCRDLSGIGGEVRPGIVHRLDKDTSGILVVAKNDLAHQTLAARFKRHDINRVYLALVHGSPAADRGRIESAIGRHPTDRKRMSGTARRGRHAVTHWKVVARYQELTLLQLRLETGRTHQIRVHLSEAGMPVVGDPVYGGGRTANLRDPVLKKLVKALGRQALHARTLGFVHPERGDYLEFTSNPPEEMQRIIDYLEGPGIGDQGPESTKKT